MERSGQHISQVLRQFGRPSWLTRYWLPVTAICYTSYAATATFVVRRQDFLEWMMEVGHTTRKLVQDWLLKPLYNVYKTIRHDEGRIAIMNRESVHADLEVSPLHRREIGMDFE